MGKLVLKSGSDPASISTLADSLVAASPGGDLVDSREYRTVVFHVVQAIRSSLGLDCVGVSTNPAVVATVGAN